MGRFNFSSNLRYCTKTQSLFAVRIYFKRPATTITVGPPLMMRPALATELSFCL